MRLLIFFLFLNSALFGQDPLRFLKEVQGLKAADSLVKKKNLNLFTGSSSIRLWTDLQQRFPEHNILNTAFGGSLMLELHYFTQELIVDYKPRRVFIYEGDNDLGEGKSPEQIIADANKVLAAIRCGLKGNTRVYFITPKPSIRRWHLKAEYEKYISLLKSWAKEKKRVRVIDVWSPMLDAEGNLKTDLFLEDGLHMNEKGYDLWTPLIRPHLVRK
jgi:lysophospholipase L1-like esterase